MVQYLLNHIQSCLMVQFWNFLFGTLAKDVQYKPFRTCLNLFWLPEKWCNFKISIWYSCIRWCNIKYLYLDLSWSISIYLYLDLSQSISILIYPNLYLSWSIPIYIYLDLSKSILIYLDLSWYIIIVLIHTSSRSESSNFSLVILDILDNNCFDTHLL